MTAVLKEFKPVFEVNAMDLVRIWDQSVHAAGEAEKLLKNLADGTRVLVSDPAILENLGVIVKQDVRSSSTLEEYTVSLREVNSGFEKYHCTCKGFTYHGYCKHSGA